MKNINFKFLIFLLFLNQSIFGMYNMIENSESNENMHEESEDYIKVTLEPRTDIAQVDQNIDWRDRQCMYCLQELYQANRNIHLFACAHPLHAAHEDCYNNNREFKERIRDFREIPCPTCRKTDPVRLSSIKVLLNPIAGRNNNTESLNITILPVENPTTNNSRRRDNVNVFRKELCFVGTFVCGSIAVLGGWFALTWWLDDLKKEDKI